MSTWLIVVLSIATGLSLSVLVALFLGRTIRLQNTQPTPPEPSDTPPGGGPR